MLNIQDVPKVSSWVVTAPEKALFDQIFEALDIDYDGFIVGKDQCVKEMFIKTGLSHTVLALIWGLCDIKQNGKLNSEQFALAMHLVNEVKNGHELPRVLTPEMIPPTLRPKPMSGSESISSFGSTSSIPLDAKTLEPTHFTNKELEDLASELRELQKEMNQLEQEVNQQETQQKLKESEVKSLHNEFETLNQMLKQLENQKVEANRRLNDMEIQKNQLSSQMEQQKAKVKEEESRLKVKQQEFSALQSEEEQLESELDSHRREIDQISKEIAESQLQCSQFKSKLASLEDYELQLENNTKELETALLAKDIHKLNQLLANPVIVPEELRKHIKSSTSEPDPFADNSDFPSLSSHFAKDPFAGEDPFSEAANAFAGDNDPFAKKDAFFQPAGEDLFANDGFASAFGKSTDNAFQSTAVNDPFAPKPLSSPSGAIKSQGSTPELPPKNSKVPPPRPAPPKQNKPRSSTAGDPWAGDSGSAFDSQNSSGNQNQASAGNTGFDAFGNFANFANFDQAVIPPPVSPYTSLARPRPAKPKSMSIGTSAGLMDQSRVKLGSYSSVKSVPSDMNNNVNEWTRFNTGWSRGDYENSDRVQSMSLDTSGSSFSVTCATNNPWQNKSDHKQEPEVNVNNSFDLWTSLMAEEKRRKEQQEQEDYELALRLSMEEEQKRNRFAN